jgi:hypothetical protein
MDWFKLAQDRNQRKALLKRGDEPPDSIECWEILE